MKNSYFISFELVAYSLSPLCFICAFKKGMGNVLRLLAGIIFGLLLELATIRQLNAYSYAIRLGMWDWGQGLNCTCTSHLSSPC